MTDRPVRFGFRHKESSPSKALARDYYSPVIASLRSGRGNLCQDAAS